MIPPPPEANEPKRWKRRLTKYWPHATWFLVGFLIGLPIDGSFLTSFITQKLLGQTRGIESRLGPYRYVDPLLDCEVLNENQVPEFNPLRKALEQVIADQQAQKNADHVSVYFRSLNSGRWVGINDQEKYAAASLTKVAFLMAYDKLAEANPDLLSQKFTYKGEDIQDVVQQDIPPAQTIEMGKSYTVSDLLSRMIIYSGNRATALLLTHIDPHQIDRIFADLRIPLTVTPEHEILISPRDYSLFFRVLYNASYLNEELSDQALELLTRADFKNGLVAGVPSGVPVAHKFGERVVLGADGKTATAAELHDCGIVYYKDHPYFLCVMTRGSDLQKLEGVVQKISKAAYANVTQYWDGQGGKP